MNFVDYGDDFIRVRFLYKKERYFKKKDVLFYLNCINFIWLLLNIFV